MKKTASILFLAVMISSGWAFAQEEDSTTNGIVPFELKEHLIIIKGKINGSQKSHNFLLDTGGLTFVDKKVAEDLMKRQKSGKLPAD